MLFRDMAGDAATKAATKVNPSDEALAQIDRPAEDNTWHDAPDLSKDNLKNQIQSKVPIGKKEAKEAAGDASAAAHPDGSRDPTDTAALAAQEQQDGQPKGVDAATGAKAGATSAKDRISNNMDEDQKQKMREYRERTREYFKGKMPKERREQVIFRLKKMIVEIQGHQDCECPDVSFRRSAQANKILQTSKPLTLSSAWQRSTVVMARTLPVKEPRMSKVPARRVACRRLRLT